MRLAEYLSRPAKRVFGNVNQENLWHTSAHLLGLAMEEFYGNRMMLTVGPTITNGFYYDGLLLDPTNIEALLSPMYKKEFVSEEDYPFLMRIIDPLLGKDLELDYQELTKLDALHLFRHSPFKMDLIHRIPSGEPVTVYRMNNFVDLCRGPHISPKHIKSFKILNTGSARWHNDSPQVMSRTYGISFESKKELKVYLHRLQDAERRNHRVIGKQQQLFHFDETSPGSPFFLPHGMRLFNTLLNYLKTEYRLHGYEEITSPLIFDKSLWETSGHWQNYRENMFTFEDETTGLKPMNCPGHCLVFKQQSRSYRDLPLRLCEFSPLHRKEASGAISGLTRVIKFHQDDGHIFCAPDQIQDEIRSCLELIDKVYNRFGFNYELKLSTRPEKFMGKIEDWNAAEAQLKNALTESGQTFTIKEGDGAFYGPKIDVHLKDALDRSHQTATIQLDFQLPQRFELKYMDKDQVKTPVIIHRAILGSLERFLGILIEHYAGIWPFWLSPRQMLIIPVADKHLEHARSIYDYFFQKGIHVDMDTSDKFLNKKIRESTLYNYVLVIGDKELSTNTLSVRRNNQVLDMTMEELLKEMK
ncbi:hypothetical protein EDD86DRAFT_194861 [Gorgonomyces haynaldii]|nr:hypothetical protein EDD86DRAFT_194861 [Gorgonomyces haynaldii]